MPKKYDVYIITNYAHSVLNTGFTGNIAQSLEQHSSGIGSKFAGQYNAYKLVYLQIFNSVHQAIE
jgi:putative endonuclease